MIREIWDTLTKEGKRSLLRSVAGFVLYALFGAAMILLMLKVADRKASCRERV